MISNLMYTDLYQILKQLLLSRLKLNNFSFASQFDSATSQQTKKMISRKINRVTEWFENTKGGLHSYSLFTQNINKSHIHNYIQKALSIHPLPLKHLHPNMKLSSSFSTRKPSSLLQTIHPKFSTNNPQQIINYNNFNVINDLHNFSLNINKLNFTPISHAFLSKQYPTVSLDLQKKLEKIQSILHSQQKNLYKIVEEILIVLEAFAQTRRRQLIEENVVKVVKEFNKKIISAYLENVQSKQLEENERRRSQKSSNEVQNGNIQQTDSNYLLHQNYSSPLPDLEQKNDLAQVSGSSENKIDINFIFYYIETIKTWLLNRVETDSIVREAENQIFELLASREVTDLQQTLKSTLQSLIRNYIEEPSAKKREQFPFDLKLRGTILLSFFDNKQLVEKYLQRLADQNMIIYMKESQVLNLLYDIVQIQPDLSNLSHFVYQIQSTKIYQNLAAMNGAYIKSLFINYTRKYMVSFQEIQFYELFRDIEPKIKYPTIRTFIRLIEILKTEAFDLHCEYNKVMNKYNYNIIISIITSQTYTVENTKFDEFFELFDSLNSLQKSGEILYEEMSKYLKSFIAKEDYSLKEKDLQRIYNAFLQVVEQAKPIYKYEEKQGLNKQFGKKTTILLNTLFDILLKQHPQVIIAGSKYLKAYLLSDDSFSLSTVNGFPFDDREINIELSNSALIESKLQKVKKAFNHLVETKVSTVDLLDTILCFLKTQVHVIKSEKEATQGQNFLKFPENFKLLQYIYTTQPGKSFDESLFTKTLQPLLKDCVESLQKHKKDKKPGNESTKITRTLYKVLDCINCLNFNKGTSTSVSKSIEQIKNILISQLKERIEKREIEEEKKRMMDIETFTMSVPNGNVEILLCLNELSKLHQKILTQSKESTSNAQPHLLLSQLPIVYNFINTIAVQNMKAIEEADLIPMLLFMKSLEDARISRKDTVLLLQINLGVYEYLYSSMSMFIMYLGDRGKYYLKLNNSIAELFMSIINHFITNKSRFRTLDSKKRLVIFQVLLVGLLRKKHLKVSSAHLKRSQHAKILLSFLEIFEYPENLTVDLKKIIEEIEFLPSDLQEFSNDTLQKYSDMNWSITRYLEDNKVGLTSSKKLTKLTAEELRKQFEGGKSSKIYEIILRNSKYQLPFELPEPRNDDQNSKLVYIIEKIYQKISGKNNYGVPKANTKLHSSKGKKGKKFVINNQQQPSQSLKAVQGQQRSDDQLLGFDDTQRVEQQQGSFLSRFQEINLESQKAYIKKQSLVNYIYQDHYKISQNKLPLHFKKQTWKNLSVVNKDLEIQSLEIDEKIDQNIYKHLLLALLGYVEKVKIIAKEFHSHSFIQYVAAQLDMEVYFHGCIARISRKNKPQDNVLFVCSIDSNYKLLYICTHILRESGQNAYIVSDKTKDNDFKDFLEKLLPQPFEPEESEIVDKVVKGQIGLDIEDQGILKEDI